MFARELKDLTGLNTSSIDKGLRGLNNRIFVERSQEIDNENKRNNKKLYKYYISEKGRTLIEATEIQYHKSLKPENKVST